MTIDGPGCWRVTLTAGARTVFPIIGASSASEATDRALVLGMGLLPTSDRIGNELVVTAGKPELLHRDRYHDQRYGRAPRL